MSDVWLDGGDSPPSSSVFTPDEELVSRLLEIRPERSDLTDEEYIKNAGFLIIQNRVSPVLHNALGINGDEQQSEIFPLAITIARLAHVITADFVKLQEGMGSSNG